MYLFIAVLTNAAILFGVSYFLPFDPITNTGVLATGGWQLYLAGGIVLGLLNTLVRPILKILGFPFVLITFGLFILVINGIILALLEKIIHMLNIGVTYQISGVTNFVIAVAIFTLFNIVGNTLIKK